jgi:predicted anti-sigma-YlaC factor YlaD
MDCKKAQGLIFTDYLDGETGDKVRALIEEHLARCPKCAEFCIAAGKKIRDPFLDIKKPEAPEYLWRKVREAVLSERGKRTRLGDMVDKARALFRIPRPILAIASVVMLIFIVGTAARLGIHNSDTPRSLFTEQAEYLDYFADAPADNAGNGNGYYGTAIEKYFL